MILTAQGFELGRCGVVVSDDFRWDPEAQAWITDPGQARDGALKTLAQHEPEAADRLIRNPYRVLLARAMSLTAICATDAATREPLAEVVNGHGC